MKVFITGGAGFIGSHLCDALVAEGEEVTILDNLSTGSKKNIAHLEGKIKVFQGDIRDQKLVESLVEKCDLVLHMAAALGVDNILDKFYYLPQGGAYLGQGTTMSMNNANSAWGTPVPGMGRSFNVGVNVKF
jgi:dTDP-D-glucose 4,6-dehydratase